MAEKVCPENKFGSLSCGISTFQEKRAGVPRSPKQRRLGMAVRSSPEEVSIKEFIKKSEEEIRRERNREKVIWRGGGRARRAK